MKSNHDVNLPPGPPGRWRPTLQLIRNPRAALEGWAKQYGDPFFIHALNGPVVVTGRPDLVRQIFAHDPMDYEVFAADSLRDILGAGSLLMLAGQEHRQERKLVMPMFHGDRMRAYAKIMQQLALDCMLRMSNSNRFDMLSVTTQISLEIIVQAIFGGEDSDSIRTLLQRSRTLVQRSSPILFFSPRMHFRFLGLSPWDRFTKAQFELRSSLKAELDKRQRSSETRQDILSMLIQARYEDGTAIDAEHACDELGTFLFAGHETSAIALSWAMYHLHHNPTTLAKLRSELQSLDDNTPEALTQLPYLKAVVQETLRMHPIVTEVLRVLKQPMTLDGYQVPAGTALAAATVLAHYQATTFLEPDQFQPERFIEHSFTAVEYFPFGGGHRRCAGAAFAMAEMAIVLGTILSHWELELLEASTVVPKRRNIAMGPSTGIRMRTLRQLS